MKFNGTAIIGLEVYGHNERCNGNVPGWVGISFLRSPDTLIAMFMGTTWDPSGADMTQVGPMLAPRTLLSGKLFVHLLFRQFLTPRWRRNLKPFPRMEGRDPIFLQNKTTIQSRPSIYAISSILQGCYHSVCVYLNVKQNCEKWLLVCALFWQERLLIGVCFEYSTLFTNYLQLMC